MSSENIGKENEQSRVANLNENGFTLSPFFIISIISAIIGIGILTLLIFMIPRYPRSAFTISANTAYDNFFYDVQYSTSSWSPTYYRPIAYPNLGYLTLMPFAVILIAVSGLGIFVRNRKEARRLIFINWALYLVPAGMAIAKSINYNYDYWDSLIHPLGFFPIYLCIFLQFSLLLDNNTFLNWTGFSKESKTENVRFNLIYRRVISIIFFVVFIYALSIPILGAFTQNIYYMMFAHVWTVIPIFISWYLFGEMIRFIVSKTRKRRKVKEYIINNYVGKTELSIPIIADYAEISLNATRTVIQKDIANSRILGEISKDGTKLFLIAPDIYFKRKEEPIEVVEPRIINEFETEPWFFWISVALSVIAVGTLTAAICFVPVLERIVAGSAGGEFNNFFYRWYYYYSDYSDSSYLRWIKPHTGAILLLSISAVALLPSGLGFLVRNKKDSKNLVFINWVLYTIPIGAGVVISALVLNTLASTSYGVLDIIGMPITLSFFYLTPLVFVQGSIFVMGNTFSEWSSFKGAKAQEIRPIRAGRMTSAIFFFLIFAWMWVYPVVLAIPSYYNDGFHIAHTSLYFGMMAWWLFGDIVGIIALKGKWKKTIERMIKMGIIDLETISLRLNIPLDVTLEVAYILINKGTIIGELDEKNKLITPKQREGAFVCVSCNKPNERDAKFCSYCGGKLDFDKLPQEVKIAHSSESTMDQELLPISKNKVMGIFSIVIFFISTVGYSVLMYFGFNYFYATIPFALFLIAGTILGAKSSYHAVGKAGYSLNTISFVTLVIYVFTMLMWLL